MDRTFEDAFMEIQTEMVQIGVDLTEKATKKADRIYILCCFGSTYLSLSSNIFFKVGNRFLHNGQMGIAEKNNGNLDVLSDFFEGEDSQMMALKKLCRDHSRPVPYEIRLVYDLVTEEFEAEYGYEPIPDGILSDDLYDAWMAEEQAKYPLSPSEQESSPAVEQTISHEPSQQGFFAPMAMPNIEFPHPLDIPPSPADTETNQPGVFIKSPKMRQKFAQIDQQIDEKRRELYGQTEPKDPKKTGFKFPFFWKK